MAVVTESTGPDISWNIINQAIWATTEADFAIISGKPTTFSEIVYLQYTACLPTMRPVWLAIRRRKHGTSTSSSSGPRSKTPYQKRTPRTWGASILKSTVLSEEDTHPFSGLNGAVEDDLRNTLVPDSHQGDATVAVQLSDVRPQQILEDGIRVENGWNIEYNQRQSK